MDQNSKSGIKIGVIVALTTLVAGYFGHLWNLWLLNGEQSVSLAAAMVVVAMIGLLVCMMLQSLLIANRALLALATGLQGIALIIALFWNMPPSAITVMLLLLGLALLIYAAWGGGAYQDRVLSISVRELGMALLPMAITAIALVTTIRYVVPITGNDFAISEKGIVGLLKPGEAIVGAFAPNFSFNMTLGDFVRANTGLLFAGQLAGVPESQKRELIAQAEVQFAQTIRQALNIAVGPKTALIDIVQQGINDQLQKIPKEWRGWVWIGFGVLVFLTIKGLASLLGAPVVWITWLVYQLLLLMGFARISYEEKQKEIVGL